MHTRKERIAENPYSSVVELLADCCSFFFSFSSFGVLYSATNAQVTKKPIIIRGLENGGINEAKYRETMPTGIVIIAMQPRIISHSSLIFRMLRISIQLILIQIVSTEVYIIYREESSIGEIKYKNNEY